MFTETDRLGIGGQFDWNIWNETLKHIEELNINVSGFNWKAGLVYRINEGFGLGLTYQSRLQIAGVVEGLVSVQPATEVFILPSKLALGVELKTTDHLTFAGTALVSFWSDLLKEYENSLDLSFNVIYFLSKELKLNLGVYQRSRRHNESYTFYTSNIESTTFLSAAAMISFSQFAARIEILDSHLFSTEHQQFTVAKLGLDYLLAK